MIIVNPEVIVANYFCVCTHKNELSYSTIFKIKNIIEEYYKNNKNFDFVIIDTPRLYSAVNSNSKYFYINDSGKIQFNERKRFDLYEDTYCIFNSKVNYDIRYHFLSKLEDILENLNRNDERKLKLNKIKNE